MLFVAGVFFSIGVWALLAIIWLICAFSTNWIDKLGKLNWVFYGPTKVIILMIHSKLVWCFVAVWSIYEFYHCRTSC